jgi:hypothetical protein
MISVAAKAGATKPIKAGATQTSSFRPGINFTTHSNHDKSNDGG